MPDALMTLPQNQYAPKYLADVVYPRMAPFTRPRDRVLEVGARPEYAGRGLLSRYILPNWAFLNVDRNWRRGEVVADVLDTPIHADVILSTCVLHHTPPNLIPQLLRNLRAPVLLFVGPNVEVLPDLFGDHQWHLDADLLTRWLGAMRYDCVAAEPIGLTAPYCELFLAFRRRAL